MRRLVMLVMFIGILIATTALAQEAAVDAQPEAQIDDPNKFSPEQILFERLWAYLAVANENASLCKTDYCENKLKNRIDTRYIGEGRCEAIQRAGFTKNVCLQVKSSACDSLQDAGEKVICSAVLSGDVAMVPKVFETLNDPEQTIEDMAEALGIIEGYRHKNIEACEKYITTYIKDEIASYYACPILFSSDPEDAYKKARSEIKAFSMAKEKKNPEICWQINVMPVRQKCFQNIVKSLN